MTADTLESMWTIDCGSQKPRCLKKDSGEGDDFFFCIALCLSLIPREQQQGTVNLSM